MNASHYLIVGKVQGVAYRAFARDKALGWNVSGWIKNNADGSVECLAAAEAAQLKLFEAALKQGPQGSRVESVKVSAVTLDAALSSFRIKY